MSDRDQLARAIDRLTCVIAGAADVHQILVCLSQIESKIMSVISDFAAKQKAFNERHGKSLDQQAETLTDLVGDIKILNDKITELQNSPGGVTPEDQVLINELETQGDALVTRTEAAAEALKVLAAQTPPVVPPVA